MIIGGGRMKKIWLVFAFTLVTFTAFLSGYARADESDVLVKNGMKALNAHNYIEAFEDFKKACEMGNGDGCNNLGLSYEKGLGVKQDYIMAAKLYKKACEIGEG